MEGFDFVNPDMSIESLVLLVLLIFVYIKGVKAAGKAMPPKLFGRNLPKSLSLVLGIPIFGIFMLAVTNFREFSETGRVTISTLFMKEVFTNVIAIPEVVISLFVLSLTVWLFVALLNRVDGGWSIIILLVVFFLLAKLVWAVVGFGFTLGANGIEDFSQSTAWRQVFDSLNAFLK